MLIPCHSGVSGFLKGLRSFSAFQGLHSVIVSYLPKWPQNFDSRYLSTLLSSHVTLSLSPYIFCLCLSFSWLSLFPSCVFYILLSLRMSFDSTIPYFSLTVTGTTAISGSCNVRTIAAMLLWCHSPLSLTAHSPFLPSELRTDVASNWEGMSKKSTMGGWRKRERERGVVNRDWGGKISECDGVGEGERERERPISPFPSCVKQGWKKLVTDVITALMRENRICRVRRICIYV